MAYRTPGNLSALSVLCEDLDTAKRERLLKWQLTGIACATLLVCGVWQGIGSSQSPPNCKDEKKAVYISQTNAAPSSTDVYMEEVAGNSDLSDGVLHLYLRNDGNTEVDQLCATAHLTDTLNGPQDVSLAIVLNHPKTSAQTNQKPPALNFETNTTCIKIDPKWAALKEMGFDLHVRVASKFVPMSGPINLSATATEKEAAEQATQQKKGAKTGSKKTQVVSMHECCSTSKLLSRPVMLLPPIQSGWLQLPLMGAFFTALLYLLIALWVLRNDLDDKVGGPQWSFATSFASNFTIGTGLLTPLLGANVLTEALHYMTKFEYGLLAILFAAFLLLAPAVFSFFSTTQQQTNAAGQSTTVSVGSMGLFLGTSAIMIGAVVGQLITVGLALAEIKFRGYIGVAPVVVIAFLLAVAGVGTIVNAVTIISSYMKPEPELIDLHLDDLQSIGDKIKSLRTESLRAGIGTDVFSHQDRKTMEQLIRGKQPEVRTWKMF